MLQLNRKGTTGSERSRNIFIESHDEERERERNGRRCISIGTSMTNNVMMCGDHTWGIGFLNKG